MSENFFVQNFITLSRETVDTRDHIVLVESEDNINLSENDGSCAEGTISMYLRT